MPSKTRPHTTNAEFRMSLVSELTQLDERINARPREPFNLYRLGIYLKAADDCMAYIARGLSREAAFVDCFTPRRDMHGIAKRLGLRLDVQRGYWVQMRDQ